MGDAGDYWRESKEHRRRMKRKKRKGWCVCGHTREEHKGTDGKLGRCERFGSCHCYEYTDQRMAS